MNALTKYKYHKSSAKFRGVEFKLTFEEWYDIWLSSGHWEQRGIGKDKYCMSRYNDTGAYEIGNVFIQTNSNNGKDQLGRSKPTPWCIGKKRSKESIAKQKQTSIDRGISYDQWSGKKMSEQSSKKKSDALKGKPWTEARKLAQLNKRKTNEQLQN